MPKPGSQSCLGCQYFGMEATPGEVDGWCIRFPPYVVSAPRASTPQERIKHSEWPVVNKDWWCGEWKMA